MVRLGGGVRPDGGGVFEVKYYTASMQGLCRRCDKPMILGCGHERFVPPDEHKDAGGRNACLRAIDGNEDVRCLLQEGHPDVCESG